jgi:DNA-binding PadR family transcriptional regulator
MARTALNPIPAPDERERELTAAPLTPTARVILGMIALGNRTGYDIKRVVDKTTRNFWAASYGQIYPELRRLEQAGLVSGRAEPSGERARTVYELTERGVQALREWLASDEEPTFELRDEGMLKLFFSDSLPQRRIENLRLMRERHERKLAALESLWEHASEYRAGPRLTLELGLADVRCLIDWCEATERRLANETDKE